MQKDERWLTTEEVCTYLSISRQTLMSWIEARAFPAVKAGKFWRYKRDEIDCWMHRPGVSEMEDSV